MVVFDRPIGAQADIKELEYISALHQSGPRLRPDGSIRDEDIKVYLRSRFGIEVSLEEVRKTILQGFGGSDEEGEVIDLMELTAIIIIPLLLKAAAVTKGQKLPPKVVPPPENILEMCAKIILHDVTGSQDKAQPLTPEFLKRMLTIYGETEMADDDKLIQEMIQIASGGSHHDVPKDFNALTFAEALTKDVELYNIANEVRKSTSVQDVFQDHHDHDASPTPGITSGARSGAGSSGENVELGLDVKKQPVREIETLKHIYTAPAIDIQAGTYRSKALTLSLWGAVLFCLFSYVLKVQTYEVIDDCGFDKDGGWNENSDAIVCQLINSIFGWLGIFCLFSAIGIFSMGMGSLGNERGETRWYLPLCGAIYVVGLGFSSLISQPSSSYLRYMAYVSIMLSIVTAYCHIGHVLTIVTKVDFEKSIFGRILGLSTLGREVHVKTAAAHKLNTLVGNAANLMASQPPSSLFKTYFGHGLSVFTTNGISKKTTGGIMWLWRRVLDQSLFGKEGIWYSARLVASNFAQLHVCMFILLLGDTVIQLIMDNFGTQEAQTEINSQLYQLLESSGLNTDALDPVAQAQFQASLNVALVSLYPQEEYMVVIPLRIGIVVAVIAALRLVLLYLPGVTATILELRSGVIPSLHSPEFQKYREAPDTVTLLTGTLFWGCLVSSVVFGAFIASIVFLFLWQCSRYFIMKVSASLLGVLCVIIIRQCFVLFCCRKTFYKGLYRTKPAAANISLLAFEWANFFFTAAFVLVRMCKVLLIAAASIGQIDRRLLAEGVGQLGPLEFDPYPTIHVRDLVAHEAHRHPFIEILGTMYLMKLRYAKHFGSRAGSAWRLVFIYALLPWMHQYRIVEKDTDTDSEGDLTREGNSQSDESGIMTTASNQHELPTLADATSMDEIVLEMKNQRLMSRVDSKRGGWAVSY